jgi:ferric-dicitrate binding protein FerR (iron transport regulator)
LKDVDRERIREEAREGARGNYDVARRTERESNTFNVSGAPRVRVETFDGAVSVHAWDEPEVMYTAVKRAADEREMQGIKLTAQGAGNEVNIIAKFDKTHARVYSEKDGVVYSSNAEAEFDLYVPRNSTLFVSSGDGRLRVDGVSGELELRTGDGAIDVTAAKGRLRAETGDGRIRVENFEGDAEARTGDGRITLDGSFTRVAARTGDGTISLSIPEGTNANVETDGESVYNDGVAVAESDAESRVRRWRVGGGGQTYTLRTGDGRIILRRR